MNESRQQLTRALDGMPDWKRRRLALVLLEIAKLPEKKPARFPVGRLPVAAKKAA